MPNSWRVPVTVCQTLRGKGLRRVLVARKPVAPLCVCSEASLVRPVFCSLVVVVCRSVMTSAGPDDDTLLLPRPVGGAAVTQQEGDDLTPTGGTAGCASGGGRGGGGGRGRGQGRGFRNMYAGKPKPKEWRRRS